MVVTWYQWPILSPLHSKTNDCWTNKPNATQIHRSTTTISEPEERTSQKLKEEPDTIILPADKRRITVIVDKTEYIEKSKIISLRYVDLSRNQWQSNPKAYDENQHNTKTITKTTSDKQKRALQWLKHRTALWTTKILQRRNSLETKSRTTGIINIQPSQSVYCEILCQNIPKPNYNARTSLNNTCVFVGKRN